MLQSARALSAELAAALPEQRARKLAAAREAGSVAAGLRQGAPGAPAAALDAARAQVPALAPCPYCHRESETEKLTNRLDRSCCSGPPPKQAGGGRGGARGRGGGGPGRAGLPAALPARHAPAPGPGGRARGEQLSLVVFA